MTGPTIMVLAKAPRAGSSKTRLAPRFGLDGAAALAAAALADTLDAVAAAAAGRRVLVLAGQELRDLPAGFEVVPQCRGGHARRIAAALAAVDGPALLIGMDTPQVTPELLAVEVRNPRVQAWLGPAADGGWWALGLREPARYARRVLAGVPMSTPVTGEIQHDRLVRAGLSVAELPVLRDVDEPADAYAVAAAAPGTRFARLVAELDRAAPAGGPDA